MTDKKISELTSITGANVSDANDVLPIVDTSVATTKKITRAELFKSVSSVDINGGTIDGTVIGGSTPAAISGTTGQFGTSLNVDGTVTADGLTVAPDANRDVQVSSFGTYSMRLENTSVNAGGLIDLKSNGGITVTSGSKSILKSDGATGDISFYEDTGTTPKFFWDASAESLGIGTSSPAAKLQVEGDIRLAHNNPIEWGGTAYSIVGNATTGYLQFNTASTERMRLNSDGSVYWKPDGTTQAMTLDASGNLLVGKASASSSNVGFEARSTGFTAVTRDDGRPFLVNRQTSDGDIIEFAKDGTTVGSIGANSSNAYISGQTRGLHFTGTAGIIPCNESGSTRDNDTDLGSSSTRFDDIYATNGTIQTSDRNEKQQIAELTAAEMQAAKAISKLFKTFKWNDSVAEKGDDARIHTGVIAQEVEAAMTDAGLDAGRYAFFISTTWWESTEVIPAVEEVLDEEGNVVTEAQPERTVTHTHDTAEEAPAGAVERNRKGIRYPQLLSFIGAATEQRLASIEARLDALETV